MGRFVSIVCVCGLVFLGLCFFDLGAGESEDAASQVATAAAVLELPEHLDWSKLSGREFLSTVNGLESDKPHLLWLDRKEIGRKAAELTASSSDSVNTKLLELARPYLTDEQSKSILASAKSWDGSSAELSELREHVFKLEVGNAGSGAIGLTVNNWLANRDISELETKDRLWLACKVAGSQVNPYEFQVTWKGTLNVPVAGRYRLSVTPFDLSVRSNSKSFSVQRTQLFIGGEKKIDTGHDGENQFESSELELTGATEIRLEYSCQRSRQFPEESPCVVQLFWEGPAIPKSIIPMERLSTDGQPGLAATYVSEQGTIHQQDERIDFVWKEGFRLAPTNHEVFNGLQAAVSSQLDASLVTGESGILQELLTTDQQEVILESLANDMDRLSTMTFSEVRRIYRDLRYADPDKAFAMLDAWTQQHPLGELRLGGAFTELNRKGYLELASMIYFQYPKHRELLEQRLSRADGGCNLAAAYTHSLIQRLSGDLAEWSQEVKQQLANAKGDARAQWLLVQACVDEIGPTQVRRHRIRDVRALIGQQWLQEATLVSESLSMGDHAKREYFARLIEVGDYARAKTIAQSAEAGDVWITVMEQVRKQRLATQQQRAAITEEALRRHGALVASRADTEL